MEFSEDRVREIVAECSGKDTVTDEMCFISDLGLDSLDVIELLMKFEDEFEIDIPVNEEDDLKTVGQAIEYLKKKVNQN